MIEVSKTHYKRWRACPKNAWLSLHRPDVFNAAGPSEFDQSLIDAGLEVEIAARQLFPGGILIGGTNEDAVQATQGHISLGTAVLFQAAFTSNDLLSFSDVLTFDNIASYSLFEIKSSNEVKQEQLYDLAFQAILLKECGLNLSAACIIHPNPHYKLVKPIKHRDLFVTVDLTDMVDEMSDAVAAEIRVARSYLLSENEPIGHCSCVYKGRSQHCTTFWYSNPDIPSYSVHDISHIGASPKKLKTLVDAGILCLDRVPADFELSRAQRAQVDVHQTGNTIFDREAVRQDLDELAFPLHFLDYETYSPPIPLFTNHCPYDKIPLQYSLHIVGAPGEEPLHREFLYKGTEDPTREFVSSLQQDISTFGTIVAWSKSFELSVNDAIARRLPETKGYMAEFSDRFYDLMRIFGKGHFIHKDLLGKTSIKNVLPILASELSYARLEIKDGTTATNIWGQIIRGEYHAAECARLHAHLSEYCKLV